jgi:acetyltransferase-like isoleucine patch superfamily enzyme
VPHPATAVLLYLPSQMKEVLRRLARRVRDRVAGPRPPSSLDELNGLVDAGVVLMGRYTIASPKVRTFVGDSSRVFIGSFSLIGEGVELIPGGMHRVDWVSTYPFRWIFRLPGALEDGHPTSKGDIVIGNDVWIGTGACILSGVTIGNGAVVGAGAVVASDVRPYALVVGNPAREVSRRFTDEQVEALQRIAWWDWPVEAILQRVDLLCGPDVDALIKIAEEEEGG